MNDNTSAFGSDPEQIDKLLAWPLTDEPERSPTSPLEQFTGVPGGKIGRYKLLRVLGEGGMGIVHLAEQQGAIRRKVALKVIKPGMDSKRVIARFETERQALALLDHPNIAQVFDAGTTEAGRPYFVMEYVKGLSITEYCDRHKLTIQERLKLFQQVCQAVHHAHQKGIIHRDIKPSNLLVSAENDQPVPKIIDFGVAKAMSQPLTERTLYTEDNHLIGTPEYMSPEQVDMANEDIDTRSDIYSLGVLLYELLTGVLPFDSETLREGGMEHIRRIIRETDPKTPSTRLTKSGEEARKAAESRQMEIVALAKCLRRELEWIPLKAMRKERGERYGSASELASDIENYLKGAPLMAGPLTTGYRLRKFLRRHKALVAGIAAVLVVSVIGTVVSVHFALGQANALAQQASALAENRAMALFLKSDILKPFAAESVKPTSIRDVFDAATEKLGTRFADYPLLEASMRFHFGNIYVRQFGDYEVAVSNMERALELQRQSEARTGITTNWLALAYNRAGRYQEAEVIFREKVERTDTEIEQGRRGPTRFSCAVKGNLGGTCRWLGRYEEAERYLREALDAAPWPKESCPEVIYRGVLADVLMDRGRYEEAEQLYHNIRRIGLSLQDKGYAGMSQLDIDQTAGCTLGAMHQLGVLHTLRGNLEEAQPLLEAALEESERASGLAHTHTVNIKISLAILRTKQGDHEEADTLLDEVLRNLQARLKDNHPKVLRTKSHLGVLRREQGRYEEADRLLTETLDGRRIKFGQDHPACLESKHELALLHIAKEDYEKAAPLLLDAYNGRQTKLRPGHPHTAETLNQLVHLYESWDKPDEAEKWRTKLLQTEAVE